MKLRTDTLTPADIYAATTSHGMRGVDAQILPHRHSYDVYLTGTSNRRPNRASDDYAATWDEWGMFLDTLFDLDPDMIAGTYQGAQHFHAVTCDRYRALTAPYQHKQHRWENGMCDCGAELNR